MSSKTWTTPWVHDERRTRCRRQFSLSHRPRHLHVFLRAGDSALRGASCECAHVGDRIDRCLAIFCPLDRARARGSPHRHGGAARICGTLLSTARDPATIHAQRRDSDPGLFQRLPGTARSDDRRDTPPTSHLLGVARRDDESPAAAGEARAATSLRSLLRGGANRVAASDALSRLFEAARRLAVTRHHPRHAIRSTADFCDRHPTTAHAHGDRMDRSSGNDSLSGQCDQPAHSGRVGARRSLRRLTQPDDCIGDAARRTAVSRHHAGAWAHSGRAARLSDPRDARRNRRTCSVDARRHRQHGLGR